MKKPRKNHWLNRFVDCSVGKLALALALTLGLARAAEAATVEVDSASALTSAISSAAEGDTIKLTANIQQSITVSKTLTLDLNGYVLKSSSGRVITVTGNLTIIDSRPDTVHYYTVGSNGLWTWNDASTSGAVAFETLVERPTSGIVALKGGAITGGAADGGGIYAYWGGATLNLQAGNIVGNRTASTSVGSIQWGAAVKTDWATFNMSGGNIVGNALLTYGKGAGLDSNGGTLNMTGGSICFNRTVEAGAGIGLRGKAKVNMTGGSIRGNYDGWVGCGIYAENNDGFVSVGGTAVIAGNKAGTSESNVRLRGSNVITVLTGDDAPQASMRIGVYKDTWPTRDNPVAITGENGTDYAANFFSDAAALFVTNDLNTVKLYGHIHCLCGDDACTAEGHTHTDLYWTPWTSATTLPDTAGNWYLTNDVTLAAAYVPVTGVNLCLNGHVVKQTTTGQRVITVNKGIEFKLTDCDSTTAHNFKVGSNGLWALTDEAATTTLEQLCARPPADAVVAVKGGCLTGGATAAGSGASDADGGGVHCGGIFSMFGGNIVGNSAYDMGGGVGVYQKGGNFVMTDGRILGNIGGINGGGGVSLNSDCNRFTMKGGLIAYNTAQEGAGVSTGGGFIMTDGLIVGNYATDAYGYGGGVEEWGETGNDIGTIITGGVISNNTAAVGGAGVYVWGSGYIGKLTLGGDCRITDNTVGGAANNVLLAAGRTISITNSPAFTNNAVIGVTTATAPTASAPVAVSSNRGEDVGYFTSDNAAYVVANQGGVVKLTTPSVQVISADGATTKGFLSLSEAYAAVADGETLRLLANQSTNVRIGKSITFDLGGHTISGTDVILVNSGATVVVSNGTIQASSDKSCCGVNDGANGGSLYVQDVTLKGFNAHYGSGGDTYFGKGVVCNTTSLYSSNGSGRLHVTDGLYTFSRLDCVTYTPSTARLFLTGGCFTYNSSTLANYLKAGYKVVDCQHGRGTSYHDVTFDDTQYAARVDHPVSGSVVSTKFASIADALNAANSGDTVVLAADRTESITVSGKSITLDLDGKTLTGTGATPAITVASGAGLTLVSGAVVAAGTAVSVQGDLAVGGNLVVDASPTNVWLAAGKTITVSEEVPLATGASIGVTTATRDATADVTANGTEADAAYFKSDSGAYTVAYATDHVVLDYRRQAVSSTSGFTGTAVGFPGSMQVYANLRAMPYSEVSALPNGTLVLFSSENPEGASWTSVPAGSARLTINSNYDNNTYPRNYSKPYTLVKGVKVNQAGTGFDTCTEGSLSAYGPSETKLAYFCCYGGAQNIPGWAADYEIKTVDAATDFTVNARPSYYDLYGETEVDVRDYVELLWGDVNISKGTVVTWIDNKATFTKDSSDAERTISFKVNDATVTVVCPKILPPPTLLYTPVKDDVVYYSAGVGTVNVPWQEEGVAAGQIVLATNKAVSAANALDNLLSAALTVDADGKVTYALGELDGGEWYGYYLDGEGHLSKPVPFYMAPETECTLTLKTVDGGTFADGTTETNIIYTHWTRTEEPPTVAHANPDMLPLGWYCDAGHTNTFTFGERLTSNTTVYACWRLKTGLTAGKYWTESNPDVAALPGSGTGWTYVETNGTVRLSGDMGYYDRLQGATTNTTLVVAERAYSYFRNMTIDARDLDRSPIQTEGYATLYFYGTNKLYSAAGIPTLAVGGSYDNLYLYGDGALFVYPGEGAEPAIFDTGCTLRICTGTYNVMSWTNMVYTSDGYYGFDNHDGTFTAAQANWVTYDMQGKAANVTDVVKRYQKFSPIADPSAEGFSFGGWYSDAACTTPYTAWYANAGYSENYRFTLYARWNADVVFDAAGGAFADGLTTKTSPNEFRSTYALPSETPTRANYKFLGWYASVTNGAPQITAETSYLAVQANVVYAKWESTQVDPTVTPGTEVVTGDATVDGLAVANVKPTVAYAEGNVVIPDRTGNDAGSKAIISIAPYAFTPAQYEEKISGATPIQQVTIPTFVTEIGKYAFYRNDELQRVVFSPAYDYKTGAPIEVYVKNYAFAETAITNVTFPAGGTYKLGYMAFAHNKMLKDVWILGDVTIESMEKVPFREVGEDCGGTTFHLSPKKAADAAFVAALTNGVNMASVAVSEEVAGAVEVTTFDPSGDPILVTFTLPADAPWKSVTTETVSLLYYTDAAKIGIGEYTQIFATKVEKQSDGSYKAEFAKPAGASGFFTVCVGD